jgi:hypothetical protein
MQLISGHLSQTVSDACPLTDTIIPNESDMQKKNPFNIFIFLVKKLKTTMPIDLNAINFRTLVPD